MYTHLSDKELIKQVLNGEQQAYTALVSRYQNYVFTLVLRQVEAREEAEELAQDVFIKAYRYLADFRGESKFSTWLYQITYTTCISHHRKRKDRTVAVEEEQMISLADRNGHYNSGVYSEKKSDKNLIAAAISQLPALDGQIISLFYQQEQSIEEIALIVGMTANNVKVRLFRARQKLKDLLKEQYITELP